MARDGPGSLRRCCRCDRLFENRFLLASVRLDRCFGNLFVRNFCDDWLQPVNRLRVGFAHGGDSRRNGNRRAQTRKSCFGFLFPLRAAEALGGRGVPAGRFGVRAGFLVDLREFKRNHRVARAFVQRRELPWGVRAGSRLADARLNLSPIAH